MKRLIILGLSLLTVNVFAFDLNASSDELKKALIQEVCAEAVAAPQRYPVGILLAQSKKTVQLCYLD